MIENVKNFRSELGILYLNDFNRKVLGKIFEENNLEFHELFDCQEYVYLWSGHPLGKKEGDYSGGSGRLSVSFV